LLVSQLATPPSTAKLWVAGSAAGLIALVLAGVVWRTWPAKPVNPESSPVPQRTTEVPAPQPKPDSPDSAGAPTVAAATTTTSPRPPQVAPPPPVARPQVAPPPSQAVPPAGARAPGEIQSSTQPNPGAAAAPEGAPPPQTAQSGTRSPEQKRIDSLTEKFETQAVEGDLDGAAMTAGALARAAPGSAYVTQRVPQILTDGYVRLAKTQFANGQMDAALQTLQAGRRKLPRSPELPALQGRYVDVATVYDRLRSAVALNVAEMQRELEALRTAAGDDSETTTKMLAQTLANRIADQRAADRAAVADRLLEAGKQIFPGSAEQLQRGTAGVLADAPPIQLDDN
jgi:hypothetical protein